MKSEWYVENVQDYAHVFVMHLSKHRDRVRKNLFIERERAMTGVPTRRGIACAEIDHDVTGELFLAEGLDFVENLLPIAECAMRLLVAKCPYRWKMRMTSKIRELIEYDFGSLWRAGAGRKDKKDIVWLRGFGRSKNPFVPRKVEGAHRVVEEDAPPRWTNEPRDGRTPTVDELIGFELTVAHLVDNTTPVKLMATFAKAEHRSVMEVEADFASGGIEGEVLAFDA
jgi:hypothetical protein